MGSPPSAASWIPAGAGCPAAASHTEPGGCSSHCGAPATATPAHRPARAIAPGCLLSQRWPRCPQPRCSGAVDSMRPAAAMPAHKMARCPGPAEAASAGAGVRKAQSAGASATRVLPEGTNSQASAEGFQGARAPGVTSCPAAHPSAAAPWPELVPRPEAGTRPGPSKARSCSSPAWLKDTGARCHAAGVRCPAARSTTAVPGASKVQESCDGIPPTAQSPARPRGSPAPPPAPRRGGQLLSKWRPPPRRLRGGAPETPAQPRGLQRWRRWRWRRCGA